MKAILILILIFFLACHQSFSQDVLPYRVDNPVKLDFFNFIPQIIRNVASPDDSSRILIAMYGWNASKRRAEVNVWLSQDKGNSYNHVLQDASTPWVSELSCAYGPDGFAYVITGASKRTGKLRGHTYGEMHVFNSSDGGLTWQGPTTGPFIDWTAATVDASQGNNRNKLYVFGHDVANEEGGWVGPSKPLIYSFDNGKSFSKPLFTGNWPEDGGGYPLAAKTNQNGIVFALYRRVNPSGLLVALSKDGGKTLELMPVMSQDSLVSKQNTFDIGFDIDQSESAFSGRLYVAYAAIRSEKPVIMLAFSDDLGLKWQHKEVSNYLSDSIQELGSTGISVNKNGIIGITWYEPGKNCQRFTISKTGGESFETPISLSRSLPNKIRDSQFFQNHLQTTGTYEPDAPKMVPPGSVAEGIGLSIRILPSGSPLTELSSDAAGAFHPVWLEQQIDGSYALLTSTISAEKDAIQGKKLNTKTLINVNDKIIVDILGQQYDAHSGEFNIDFNFTNKSDSILHGPLLLKVTKITSGFGFNDPKIVNSNLTDFGKNALFNLTNILTDEKLEPGMATKQYTFTFKVNQTNQTEEIWQKIQDGESIHPISCQFDIYVKAAELQE